MAQAEGRVTGELVRKVLPKMRAEFPAYAHLFDELAQDDMPERFARALDHACAETATGPYKAA